MARHFLLLVLSLIVGCDSVVDHPEPYTGVIEVSLAEADEVALRLVAVDDVSCGDPLVVSLDRGTVRRTVAVEGIVRPTDGTCLALIAPVAIVPLELGPELPGGYSIEGDHAGSVDLYALDMTAPRPTLAAVRTSQTRLAE